MKITFSDGEKIGVFENGVCTFFDSTYIKKYRQNTLDAAKNREWKSRTDMMISEEYYFDTPDETQISAQITSVVPSSEENKITYAFIVNNTSGIYHKYTDDKEKTEAHVISSGEVEFRSLSVYDSGEMLGTVQTDTVASRIAVFSKSGDFKYLTDGDSLDENPSFDKDGNVLFNSYAVGRDQNNNFITYLPSEIYLLNPTTLEIKELVTSAKGFSYIKPMSDSKGRLYCIRKTDAEKSDESVFMQILMIPVRIVQAIVGFISAFVMCFAKKPLVSGTSAKSIGNGGDAAKKGNADPKKMLINNNLINVDKELQKNKKSDEYGFIPKSWKLVRLDPSADGSFEEWEEFELAKGVADYVLYEENGVNTLIYTNGKQVFKITDKGDGGTKEKLFDTDFCVKVSALLKKNGGKNEKDLFDRL